jgi:hypothetical protein
LIRSEDFLDMLLNLNTCIDFMDQHVCFSALLSTRTGIYLQSIFSGQGTDNTDDCSQITVTRQFTKLVIHLF